ncbi:DedA family protein, partial [Acinetobacter baumannii]
LYDSIGLWLMQLYNLTDKVESFRHQYAEWGAVIILLKGLTPIPYKLVTITSGFAGYNIWLFILCSIVARGGRFFVLAVLLNRYGDVIRA